MKPLVLSDLHTSLRVRGHYLVVSKNHVETNRYFIRDCPFDSVIIQSDAGYITYAAIAFLYAHNIPIFFVNYYGEIQSSVTHGENKSRGRLRLKQYRADKEPIAQAILGEKVRQSLNLLRQLSRFYPLTFDETLFSLSPQNTEGRIAERYFSCLKTVFDEICPKFNWSGRKALNNSNNLSTNNPVNALLNYGYGIISAYVRTSLVASGLDTSIGFVHKTFGDKEPLVYDMMELFRHLVDISVIMVLERNRLSLSNFAIDDRVILKKDTARLMLDTLSQNFNPYQNVLYFCVRSLVSHILRGSALRFPLPLYVITHRNDTLEERNKIISLDHKRLGINKSTLWYRKQAAIAGKPRRYYS